MLELYTAYASDKKLAAEDGGGAKLRSTKYEAQSLLQILFHRREQFLDVFHLDLAHVRDAEGGFFDRTVSARDAHLALLEEGVQV